MQFQFFCAVESARKKLACLLACFVLIYDIARMARARAWYSMLWSSMIWHVYNSTFEAGGERDGGAEAAGAAGRK